MTDSLPLERPLDGRLAVVTGGAVRLGRATVLALFRRGARIAFTYSRSAAAADELLAELRSIDPARGAEALAIRCDVTREAEVDALFATLDERFAAPALLVNNAAVFEPTPFDSITDEQWRRHLDVNLTGSFLVARRAGARMKAAGEGVIVNVACAGGIRPWPGFIAYSVSKAGVVMLTQVLARALAPDVRVNAIVPGPVMLPEEGLTEEQLRRAVDSTALGRAGSPVDHVRAILFAWDSDYTTGSLIPVDGGRTIR